MVPDFVGHANTWYLEALRRVIDDGERVTTRGRTTWEVLHATTKLPDPRKRVLTIPFRRANPFFQAAECVWILAGRADAPWLTYYNSQMTKYLDPGSDYFHGAYGERLRRWGSHARTQGVRHLFPEPYEQDQIIDVIAQLRVEASSRRAVMTVHNPELDNPDVATLDRPCNIAMSYQLRDGQLHAVTFNRSNDLNLGLAFTNICQFTTIQEFIAAALGVEVGSYVHFSSSLHVYQDDPVVQRLLHPLQVIKTDEIPLEEIAGSLAQPGQVVKMAEVEYVPPARFDVYDYVAPVRMAPWAGKEQGWQLIRALEQAGDSQNRFKPFDLASSVWDIKCPYWNSVGRMALAWHELKISDANKVRGKPVEGLLGAVAYLSGMAAGDWLVACMEFVHRWAENRGLGQVLVEIMGKHSSFCNWPAPVREFVLHDGGA